MVEEINAAFLGDRIEKAPFKGHHIVPKAELFFPQMSKEKLPHLNWVKKEERRRGVNLSGTKGEQSEGGPELDLDPESRVFSYS